MPLSQFLEINHNIYQLYDINHVVRLNYITTTVYKAT